MRAQVEITTDKGERVEENCLFLIAPDPNDEDPSGYITRADLSLKTSGEHRYIIISSRQPLDEAFAKLRLQIKCPNTGTVTRTLVALPDFNPAGVPAEAVTQIEAVTPPTLVAVQPLPALQPVKAPAAPPAAHLAARHHARRAKAKSGSPGQAPSRAPSAQLKLSGNPLDQSGISKMSPQEREQLLTRQKFLNKDEQTATYLALKQQVKDLQGAVNDVKQKLEPMNAASSAAPSAPAAPVAVSAVAPASAVAQAANQPKPVAVKPPVAIKPVPVEDNSDMIFAAGAAILAILAAWLGLRYSRTRSRIRISLPYEEAPLTLPAKAAKAPVAATQPAPATAMPVKAVTPTLKEAPPPPIIEEAEPEVAEEDLLLEEASLYVAHGRAARAVDTLQYVIRLNPGKVEAWSLLLSIFSSLANVREFEETARAFIKQHPDHPSWHSIQALGRTMDSSNPLYADASKETSAASATLGRPIGEILVKMGALSQETLEHHLRGFDPKTNGRFGGYLVTRKVISLADLDHALLLQQGGARIESEAQALPAAAAPSSALPPMQHTEDLLAGFDLQPAAPAKPATTPLPAEAAPEDRIEKVDLPPLDFNLPMFDKPATDKKPGEK